jgi:acetyl esterase/lipase
MVRNLVKNTDDARHPYITPLNADSHSDLPPAILVTNGLDPLRDVGHACAQKLAAAGVADKFAGELDLHNAMMLRANRRLPRTLPSVPYGERRIRTLCLPRRRTHRSGDHVLSSRGHSDLAVDAGSFRGFGAGACS